MPRALVVRVAAVSIACGLLGLTCPRATGAEAGSADPVRAMIEADWALQDGLYAGGKLRIEAVAGPLDELGA
ncbi:MAG: hypothetical protein WBF17_14200, partial [Phycisphaerae bacterium]